MNVFFFKQKTAYEMRISDWSSDVCSSDLGKPCLDMPDAIAEPPEQRFARCLLVAEPRGEPIDRRLDLGDPPRERVDAVAGGAIEGGLVGLQHRKHRRSEEHTSELQSLMRIAYAVF